jgi:hypothetical protein
MSIPQGLAVEDIIGAGATGTVRRGRITGGGLIKTAPAWAAADIAVKTWDNPEDGAAVAACAVAAIKAIPTAHMAALIDADVVMPVAVVEGNAAAFIMPVGTPVSNRDWRHVLALVERIAGSGTDVAHMDVKAANTVWHNGVVKFVDHDALYAESSTQLPALPSYAPWIWRRWVPDMHVPATRHLDPEAYDDAYYTAYDLIATTLSRDRDGVLALMYWGALATAITMTTGDGNPVVTAAAVHGLGCTMATRLWKHMVTHWGNSIIAAEVDRLGAGRHENST